MKTLLLNLGLVVGLASCTTDPALNRRIMDTTTDIVTLGLAQNAPVPQPLPTTSSK